jgi:hypothetical protein
MFASTMQNGLSTYLTVNDALREFLIGRTKLYELTKKGEIVSNRRVGRRLIETKSLLRLLSDDDDTEKEERPER